MWELCCFFFFQAEDGIRDADVTGVQTCALPISAAQAAIALTAFWAMVTVGRVLLAALGRTVSPRTAYRTLPFLLAVTFVVVAALPDDAAIAGIVAFGLAGLFCSALLPLTIGFGEKELVTMAAAVAGGIIAAYQLGYGIAAFGVGPLLDGGVSLSTIYGAGAVVALLMGF